MFGAILVVLLCYYAIFILKNFRLLRFSAKNNGFLVPILPFIGTMYIIAIKGRKVDSLSLSMWLKEIFGHPCNLWLGNKYLYFTSNFEEIKTVLNHPKCIDKAMTVYKNFEYFFGKSLFTVETEKWKIRRKQLLKSYRPVVLKNYQPIFYKASCELLEKLPLLVPDQDLFYFFNMYSFTNFFLTSVGLEEPDPKKVAKIGMVLDRVQELVADKFLDPITPLNLWLRFSSDGQKVEKYVAECKNMVTEVILEKRLQHSKNPAYWDNSNAIPLFDSMIIANMTDDEIFDEISFFAGAAADTTGHTLAFAFTLLGMFPEVQDKLYAEAMSVLGHNSVSFEDLPRLKYTEAVICETLRLLPSVPLVGRTANEDINVGTKIIPKGTNMILDIFHMQRDSKFWDNPLKFDPKRFLMENGSTSNNKPYLPFLCGPRDCLGKTQAIMVLKTTLANVIRSCKVVSNHKSVEDFKLTSCLSLKTTHPLHCQFIPRL